MKQAVSNGVLGILVAMMFVVVPPHAHAWSVKSLYPTPMDPAMPSSERAQAMVSDSAPMLSPLRRAHQESLQRSWKGFASSTERGKSIEATSRAYRH
jgi:hypothetical protein